jgi:hypothetical protein
MAEFAGRDVRLNETTSLLEVLAKASLTRVPAPSPGPAFRSLPDGRVINRYGEQVYTPKSSDAQKRS